MNASIDETGTLRIEPETALESYALKQWSRANMPADKVVLLSTENFIIDCSRDSRQPAST